MNTGTDAALDEVKHDIIGIFGRTAQDLGFGRILGQVTAYVYLSDHDCSLDEIGAELGLSKAAVSIAARQLERLGVLRKVWKKGDRKHYYCLVTHLGAAVRKGVISLIRSKIGTIGEELTHAEQQLATMSAEPVSPEMKFVQKRLQRAQRLRKRMGQILDNPFIKLLGAPGNEEDAND